MSARDITIARTAPGCGSDTSTLWVEGDGRLCVMGNLPHGTLIAPHTSKDALMLARWLQREYPTTFARVYMESSES